MKLHIDKYKKAACTIFYYHLDECDLMEHGGCIPGWLTKEGFEFFEDIQKIEEEYNKKK